jgi:uncharacterized protein DUF4321
VRRGVGFVVLVVVVGAVAGSLVGELLGMVIPHGFLHALATRGVSVGIPHFRLDLLALSLSLGLTLRVNLCTLAGIALAVYFFRR